MEKVQVVLDVPKETKEVIDALSFIAMEVKAKKGVAEIAAGALPKLIAAVDGYDKLDDEFKADKGAISAYLVKELMGALGV